MNIDRDLADLKAGIKTVTERWGDSGHSSDRVNQILSSVDKISWGSSRTGIDVDITERGPADLRVVVLEQTPDPRTGLHDHQAFQTWLHFGDSVPTVYFQHVSCTALWLGILLCHELDHALEYRDGVSKPDDRGAAWEAPEGRAYLHEGVLIDGLTGGNFRRCLAGHSFQELLQQSAVDLSSRLYHDSFSGAVKVQRKSDREHRLRISGLIAGGAMLVAADQMGDSEAALAQAFAALRRTWFA